MNDLAPIPRHRQKPITIRSDVAAELLAQLTQDGRSQAQVIEDALKREAKDRQALSKEAFIARISAIVKPLQGLPGKTFKQIDDEMWDENGLPI